LHRRIPLAPEVEALRGSLTAHIGMVASIGSNLEHDPEKWELVFGKDHAPTISWSGVTIHPALGLTGAMTAHPAFAHPALMAHAAVC